jgi:asparagine synthase (glutamine-hydrolysing)
MSHFALTCDPDPVRREQFVSASRHVLALLPGMEVQSAEVGHLAVVWSYGKNTPLSVESSSNAFSLLLGYALTEAGERLNAWRILELWKAGSQELDTLDGYFLGVASSADGALSVMCDPLGLFPVYYSVRGDVLVVGSSPACCLAHPACPAVLDVRGLAGILLINGLMDGRTLVQGVTRLKFGHCLEWNTEHGVREREIFRLQCENTWQNMSHDAILKHAEEMMRKSVQRHCPPGAETALLLSGGLDSRVMAAVLSDEKIPYKPFTWGRPDDFEMRAARAVADKLGLPLMVDEYEASHEEFVGLVRQTAQWSAVPGGSGGFGEKEGNDSKLAVTAPFFWSGFVFDLTLGGLCMPPFPSQAQTPIDFETALFQCENKWGIAPDALKRLMRPVLAEADVDALVAGWKETLLFPGLSERQKGFFSFLLVRARYHLGSELHRLSGHSWPLLPFLERQQLQFLFNLESAHLERRRLEMELLRKMNMRFLDVPFDTNSFRFGRLQAKKSSAYASWGLKVKDRLMSHALKWYWMAWKRSDPRRYYRQYDLNAPQWHAVREAVESLRVRTSGLFDPCELQAFLPPCEVPFRHVKPFAEGTSCKNVMGVLIWLDQNPQAFLQEKN